MFDRLFSCRKEELFPWDLFTVQVDLTEDEILAASFFDALGLFDEVFRLFLLSGITNFGPVISSYVPFLLLKLFSVVTSTTWFVDWSVAIL